MLERAGQERAAEASCAACCLPTPPASISVSRRPWVWATRCCARNRRSAPSPSSCIWRTTSSRSEVAVPRADGEASTRPSARACSACRRCRAATPRSTASSRWRRREGDHQPRAQHHREAQARRSHPRTLAVVGRYVLAPAIFEHLEKIGPGSGRGDPADRRHRGAHARGGGLRLPLQPASATTAAASSATCRRPSSTRSGMRISARTSASTSSTWTSTRRPATAKPGGARTRAGTSKAHGSQTLTSAPPPARFARLSRPPCASTISRHSVSPRPVPVGFVEKNGSSASRSVCSLSRVPRSATSMRKPARRARGWPP